MTTSSNTDDVPRGLQARGRAFWRKIRRKYELNTAELELLLEASRLLDTLDRLQAAAAKPMVPGSKGQPRVNPALPELRAGRAQLTHLLEQLQIPKDEQVPTPAQLRARKAAESRWAEHRRIRGAS